MKLNTRAIRPRTHEGAVASPISPAEELRRSVLSCLLWENQFYESGEDIAARIARLVPKVGFDVLAELVIEARECMKLRHVPLLLVREGLRHYGGRKMGDLIERVIQRPDEMGELMALYWKENPDAPLAKQLKVGLARAFRKFDAYQLAKYDRNASVRLRDVVFLTHVRAGDNRVLAENIAKLVNKESIPAEVVERYGFENMAPGLSVPDTWEVALSSGKDKRETFERMIQERKLGALAMLRNLRGMIEADVPEDIIRQGLSSMKTERVLPFRFLAAARYAPQFEPELEAGMFSSLNGVAKLPGMTVILVDISSSMEATLSTRGDMKRVDAAYGLAIMAREVCEQVRVMTFSDNIVEVPPRRGFALRDAMHNSQAHSATYLGKAVKEINRKGKVSDRLIVITDEQSQDQVPAPKAANAYMINVASFQNGIGYEQGWTHINGWSEHVVRYIAALEGVADPEGGGDVLDESTE